MSREDVEAGKAYLAKNWPEIFANYTTAQKLRFLMAHSPDEQLRQQLSVAFAQAKTEAMQQMLIESEWHERFIKPHLDAVMKTENDSEWTEAEEKEARRLFEAGTIRTATALREMLSMRQKNSQSLFRHITGKEKKKHRTD